MRTNTARKKELRELHDRGRIVYLEERTDPCLRRKVWDIKIGDRSFTLTTSTIDGFLLAARELDDPADIEDREGEPAGAGLMS
jgi:hypothetical protein